MTEQTSITPYERFKNIVKKEDVQARFKDILNQRGPAFLASLISVVSGNDALQKCEPATILTSAAKAAILNLPIEQSLGFAYIVPFGKDATFVLGYKGMIQLAIRTSMYEAINATNIYEGEAIREDRLTGKIVLNGNRTGDKVTGYVAYFKLRNGFEKYHYMSVEQVTAHAKKYSKSYGNGRSAWTTNFDDMGKKTVLRLLLGRYGLMSIDMQDTDDATLPVVSDDNDPRFAMPEFGDVVDGEAHEVVEQEAQTEQAEPNVFDAVVAHGLSDNEFAAREALKHCTTGCDTGEKAVAWMRLYRGWRDMGGTVEQAAKAANNGEVPK